MSLPPVPAARALAESLSAADVHVVGLARGLAGYVVPSRLYGILAAGRPVIVAAEDESETAQLVREVGCGVVVPPGGPLALAEAIRAAHDGVHDLEEMGRRARDYAETRADRAIAVARYRALLAEVVGRDRRSRSSSGLRSARSCGRTSAIPLAAALAARLRTRRPAVGDELPTVAVIVAAYNEESVIERRLENLLALDYPRERLELVVASDASTDRTDEIVEAIRRARRPARAVPARREGRRAEPRRPRSGRRDRRVLRRERDLGAGRAAQARAQLRRSGRRVRLRPAERSVRRRSQQGGRLLALRALRCARTSRALDSVTGGNGSIYAVRRSDYVEVDPRFGHDLSFPYLMVQHGRRAVYEPEAHAYEKATPTNEDEYRRKVRMFEHCWAIVFEGKMLRGQRPLYFVELLSRTGTCATRAVCCTCRARGERRASSGRAALRRGPRPAARASARRRSSGSASRATTSLVTWATVVALWNYLRRGVPTTWEAAEGTR